MMPVFHPRPTGVLPTGRALLLLTMTTAEYARKWKGTQKKRPDLEPFSEFGAPCSETPGLSPQLRAKAEQHRDVLPSVREMEQRMELVANRTRSRTRVARLVEEQIWNEEA